MDEPICRFNCRKCENNTADDGISCAILISGVRGIIKPTEDGKLVCVEYKEREMC